MKKCYSAPQLKVHGTVEAMTQDVTKTTGKGDFYAEECLNPLTCSNLC